MNTRGEANRRVRATKRALQNAMVELMKEKPVEAITVRELTELADVNRSTFYLHYADVYDLLDRMEDEAIDELGALLTAEAVMDFDENGYPMLVRVLNYLNQNHDRFIVLLGANGNKKALRRAAQTFAERLIEVWSGPGGLPRTKELEMAAWFAVEGAIGMMENQYGGQQLFEWSELVGFSAHITQAIHEMLKNAGPE